MKIIRLKASNIKRLKAIEIEPDPDSGTVIISGKNGQGKTSVLDSIWLALGGGSAGKESGTIRTIRDGEDEAIAELTVQGDAGDGSDDIIVQRTWTRKKDGAERTFLRVSGADGKGYTSPQSLLDSLIGRLSFDPLAFANAPEKEQVATLLSMIDLPFDLDVLAEQRRNLFEERTIVGRTAKQKKAEWEALPRPLNVAKSEEPVEEEEESARDIIAELNAARQEADRIKSLEMDKVRFEEIIADLKARLAQAEAGLKEAVEYLEFAGDAPDVEAIARRLDQLEERNQRVRKSKAWYVARDAARAAQDEYDDYTAQIAALDRQKEIALSKAEMPIAGLGFDDDGVTYNGVPFKQASAAEQLRVSLAIAMAANPKLRVIRISDGSLLDSGNLALVNEMAKDDNFQVWVERVDDTGSAGVVIEDGMVTDVK